MCSISSSFSDLLHRYRVWSTFSNDGTEMVDRTLQSAVGATNIAKTVMERNGNNTAMTGRIVNGMSDAQAVISATRLTWSIGDFLTGSAFIRTNPDGSLMTYKKNQPDGKKKGQYIWNSFALIALKVALFVGKALSLTNWLESKKICAIDPKHTSRMNHAVAGAFTLVSTCGLYLAYRRAMSEPAQTEDAKWNSLKNEQNVHSSAQFKSRAFMDMTRNGFDLASCIFDIARNSCFGCSIASAVLSLCSGLSWLAYELAWHQKQ